MAILLLHNMKNNNAVIRISPADFNQADQTKIDYMEIQFGVPFRRKKYRQKLISITVQN